MASEAQPILQSTEGVLIYGSLLTESSVKQAGSQHFPKSGCLPPTTRHSTMKFEDAFQYMGDIGLFQVMLYLMVGIMNFINSPQSMGINFAAGYMDHWCKVERLQNWPHDVQKYIAIPYNDDSNDEYDTCRMYDLDYANFTDEDIWNWNRSFTENATTIECTGEGWVYDQSEFVSTINSKFDLVCGRSWMSQFVSTVYMFGMFISSIFAGFISDRMGRRPTLLVSLLLHFGFAIGQALAPNYTVFVIMRFLVAVTNYTTYVCGFVIVMEFLGPSYRTKLGSFYLAFGSLGTVVASGVSFSIRNHMYFLMAVTLPALSLIPLIWIMPESPRWLISRGRLKDAERIVRNVAAINGRQTPEKITWETSEEIEKRPETDDVVSISTKDVCGSTLLCKELALMCLNWFTTSLVFYGLSLNAGAFGSVFLNTFLMAFIEIPAHGTLVICMQKGSKRWSNSVCLLLAGAFCLSCVPVMVFQEDMNDLLTALSTIGKGCIAFSFGAIYVITAELFPTPVRHKAVGTCSVFARIGSMLSPYMGPPMQAIWTPLPSMIFGCLAVFTGFMVLFLPETKGHKIPDNIEEAEFIGRYKKRLKTSDKRNTIGTASADENVITATDQDDSYSYTNKAFVDTDVHKRVKDANTKQGAYGNQDIEFTSQL